MTADNEPYTRMPNALLDLLPLLPDAECRVVLVIVRKTIGWQKACDVISYTQLEAATGMSHQGVINGVESAIKRGIVKRDPSGHNNGYCYEIVYTQVVNEVDRLKQSTKQTSQRSRLQVVNEVDHQVVNEVDTQKKELKEKKEKRESARAPVSLDFLHEGVTTYKRLTGKRTVTPTVASQIAAAVTDLERWEKVIIAWCSKYRPENIAGMLEWYADPKRMENRNGTHQNGRSAHRQTEPRTDELNAYLASLPDYDD